MGERRRTVRAPILTQVEALGDSPSILGRAKNISLGGLLIETPDTLPVDTTVIVRFFLPRQPHPIEAAGRVVRMEASECMAVTFHGLTESQQKRVLEHVGALQAEPTARLPFAGHCRLTLLRRTGRVKQRVPVILTWQDEEGHVRQEATEATNLSQFGAMLHSFSELQPGQLARVLRPGTEKEALARVVQTAAAGLPGRQELGLELLGTENFWGLQFPADQLPAPEGARVARRRSARLPRRLDVILNWADGSGGVREATGQTRLVSQHGAALSVPILLLTKQRCRFQVPQMEREVDSHVVWVEASKAPNRTGLGIEFLGSDNFWDVRFPPDPGSSLG